MHNPTDRQMDRWMHESKNKQTNIPNFNHESPNKRGLSMSAGVYDRWRIRTFKERSLCPPHKVFWYSQEPFDLLRMSCVIHFICLHLPLAVRVYVWVCPCMLICIWITHACVGGCVRVAVRSYMQCTEGWNQWISSTNVILEASRTQEMRGQKWGRRRCKGLTGENRKAGWYEEKRLERDERIKKDSQG